MIVCVAGGTGATGRHLVRELLARGHTVRVVVRSAARLPDDLRGHKRLEVTEASLLDLSDDQLEALVKDCDVIASCLGHSMTWKGLFGKPRRLVTDAVKRLCHAVRRNHPPEPVRFVLMNSSGVRNPDLGETISAAQSVVIHLLRLLVPPHADNEAAAQYLREVIGHNDPALQWVAVRPDSLENEDVISEYEFIPSPTRSAIFDSGKISRINVAHGMAELATNDAVWEHWKGRTPVMYSADQASSSTLRKR